VSAAFAPTTPHLPSRTTSPADESAQRDHPRAVDGKDRLRHTPGGHRVLIAALIRSAASTGSSCSQTRRTRQPAAASALARRKVHERLVFELADAELDDGVLAVLGFDDANRLAAVGQKREVTPIGPELALGAEQPGAPDDQALLADQGVCDLPRRSRSFGGQSTAVADPAPRLTKVSVRRVATPRSRGSTGRTDFLVTESRLRGVGLEGARPLAHAPPGGGRDSPGPVAFTPS
jgi:hypothetical protein